MEEDDVDGYNGERWSTLKTVIACRYPVCVLNILNQMKTLLLLFLNPGNIHIHH